MRFPAKIKINRFVIRGVFFSGLSVILVFYEIITVSPPHIELVVGYTFVFAYGVFTILTRRFREQVENVESHEEE